ncbi:hypothetical protein PCANC_10623 [Puccinia coronata f. sp. avenae]|uniref:Uncharacterized protein n=1 Tax=Puccinia coronata f. sp. avenae TaxID=200324 RepID=A0A2N5U798_9BASI|nr:hypothetical protein PCASD_15735 [Puccinia coronata f. sp. avenae]PLW52482.1 hypothetical protein PCANC_10623 [Puccinia coronata f. sp. avenae]
MRLACATAGVLVMATVSQARSIARSPATPSQSHERTEALHLVSAVHHSKRSTGDNDDWKNYTTNSPNEDRHGDAMAPSQNASPKDAGHDDRVYESSAKENSRERPSPPNSISGTEHEDHTPPGEPDSTKESGTPGRVHEYSAKDSRGRQMLPGSSNGAEHEDHTPPAEPESQKDSGNGQVHEYSAQDSRERQPMPASSNGAEHEDHTPPAEPDSTRDSGHNGRVHEYSAKETSNDRQMMPTSSNRAEDTPPGEPEGQKDYGNGRVHEYSAQDSRERQVFPTSSNGAEHEDRMPPAEPSSNGAEHEDHTPPAEPESQKDSGNGQVHENSAQDSRERQNMPASSNGAEHEDHTPPAEPDSTKDSGHNGRVHEYSAQDESTERLALPTLPPLGSPTVGAQPTRPSNENPPSTAILLQAIQEYHEAMRADDSTKQAASPPSGKPRHMLQVFPLLKYQTRPVRPTIHELRQPQNHTAPSAGARAVQQNHSSNSTEGTPDMAFGNLSSLSNNTPLSSDLPIAAISRDLLNISSLSNNAPPMSSPENPSTHHDTPSIRNTQPSPLSDSHNGSERESAPNSNITSSASNSSSINDSASSSNNTAPTS